MQKAALVAALAAALSAPAFADTASTASSGAVSNSGSTSVGNVGNVTTNNMTPSAGALSNANTASTSTSSNNGNNQVIQFITPPAQSGTGSGSSALQARDLNGQPLSSNTRSENVISGSQEQYVEYGGTYTIRNVPSVNGPPLTTSNDTCMGSTSGSINGPGFGVGLGSTWTDRNCVMLKNARELWNMGMKAAAMALMCTDASNRSALEITGFACPQTVAARNAQAQADRQALVVNENEQLKARLAALESEKKAKPAKASTGWFGRTANPSAEAMLPAAAVPVPTEAKVEATPVQDAGVEATSESGKPTLIRVVSDPRH